MKNSVFPITGILISAIPMTTCGSTYKIWPSDRIGPMWVNRYCHTVDLPAFNVADFDAEQEGKRANFGCGGSGCGKFPKVCIHSIM